MKKNMSSTDSIVRFLLAIVMVALYLTSTVTGTLGVVLLILAGVFVITGIFRICPLYMPFGIKTCKTD